MELMSLLTNLEFLRLDKEGIGRIFPPNMEGFGKALGYTRKNFFRIFRAYNFLYNFRVCFVNIPKINLAKIGFF